MSCSPFRVPVARLAAAQAALEEEAHAAKGNGKLSRNGISKVAKAKLPKARR